MKHFIIILTLAASIFGSAFGATSYLNVEEGAEWTFQEFFELPQADKVYSKNVLVSKVQRSQANDAGETTAYISNFLGQNKDMWLHVRDNSVFLNGNGYVQAFRFDGRGEYNGSFNGGVKGKSTISIDRNVAFTTRNGSTITDCIRFIEHTEAGQTEVIFAPELGPVCVREVKSNGAARGYELFQAETQVAKAN